MTISHPSALPVPHRHAAYGHLLARKNSFMISMAVTLLVLYLLLPLLAGYNRPLMATRVLGNVTFGHLLALVEISMGWVLTAICVAKTREFDRLANAARP